VRGVFIGKKSRPEHKKETAMRFIKSGVAGIATVAALAVVSTLTPGALASTQSPGAGVAALRAAAAQSSAGKQGTLTSKVKGAFPDGTVDGQFRPDRFVAQDGDVFAVGTLSATLRRTDGTLVGRVHKPITIPVRSAFYPRDAKSCDILDLILGPLHLNLLGLHVDLKKVVLHIVAVSGAGNLLGNLLCAVAHLLDGTRLIDLLKLANLLNKILSLLRI
jgi:hypothetical protein